MSCAGRCQCLRGSGALMRLAPRGWREGVAGLGVADGRLGSRLLSRSDDSGQRASLPRRCGDEILEQVWWVLLRFVSPRCAGFEGCDWLKFHGLTPEAMSLRRAARATKCATNTEQRWHPRMLRFGASLQCSLGAGGLRKGGQARFGRVTGRVGAILGNEPVPFFAGWHGGCSERSQQAAMTIVY